MILAAKLALPLAMVTVGVGAATVAVVTSEPASTSQVSTAAHVWIDAPTGEEPVAPGEVHVGAHATAEGSIGSLDLYVDGKKVATDASLERNEKLVYGTFDWGATEGVHELVVAQPGSDRSSAPVEVVVSDDSPVTTTAPGTTSTVAVTTTSTEPDTTTTTATLQTTTVPPTVTTPDVTAPPPSTVPTTRPPTTVPPTRPAPIIDGAAMDGTEVYRLECGYPDVTVTVRARNATGAQVVVEGTSFRRTMVRNGASFTGTIPSGVWSPSDVGWHAVTVVVSGPGGSARRGTGSIYIEMTCPKD
ncbi:MAG: hypothetical protein KDB02_09625 [Acidimicrobiales bacterium]|nr:hypothetical protein [Acidimicrobiales bacterium]